MPTHPPTSPSTIALQAALWGIADLHHQSSRPSAFLRQGFAAAAEFFERTGQVVAFRALIRESKQCPLEKVSCTKGLVVGRDPPASCSPLMNYSSLDPCGLLVSGGVDPAAEVRLQQLAATALGDPARYFLLAELAGGGRDVDMLGGSAVDVQLVKATAAMAYSQTDRFRSISGDRGATLALTMATKCLWATALRVPDGDSNWLDPTPFFVPAPPLGEFGPFAGPRL